MDMNERLELSSGDGGVNVWLWVVSVEVELREPVASISAPRPQAKADPRGSQRAPQQ